MENGDAVAAGPNGVPQRRRRKRPRPDGDAEQQQEQQEQQGEGDEETAVEEEGDGGGGGGSDVGSTAEEGEDDAESVAARRRRREELGEEDEEDAAPLVAEGEVGANLCVWARTLERPPKGNLRSYSEGLWRPDKQLCRIIKPRGNDLRCMGFALEGDVHLYPEETLFLVERCKLEVGNVTTPQLYESVDLLHYLAYSYFKQTSLIVFRAEPFVPEQKEGEGESEPIPPPPGVAFEAYAPTGQFSKKHRGRPIMYIMYGGTRAPVPTEEELVRIFAWARGVPLKYAMISDEGGVFAVNLAPRPLENHTHLQARRGKGRPSWKERQEQKLLKQQQEQEAAAAAAAAAVDAAAAAGGGGGGGGGGEGMEAVGDAAAGGGEAAEAGAAGGVAEPMEVAQEEEPSATTGTGADVNDAVPAEPEPVPAAAPEAEAATAAESVETDG